MKDSSLDSSISMDHKSTGALRLLCRAVGEFWSQTAWVQTLPLDSYLSDCGQSILRDLNFLVCKISLDYWGGAKYYHRYCLYERVAERDLMHTQRGGNMKMEQRFEMFGLED